MSGRISALGLGSASGLLYYYAIDTSMLRNVRRADKRAQEIREELIGMVTSSATQIKHKAKSMLVTPLVGQNEWPQYMAQYWNSGVETVHNSLHKLLFGGDAKK
jgi:hypothetical protein